MNSTRPRHRQLLAGGAAAFTIPASLAVQALPELPIGLPAESSFVLTVLRLVLAVLGGFLLVAGAVRGRAVVGSLALLVGLAIGLVTLGEIAYVLSLLAALLVCGGVLLVYQFCPRFTVGLLLFWPLPLLYAAHLFGTGSFDRNLILALVLAAAGPLLGWLLPRLGSALLASSVGLLFLYLALPWRPGFVGLTVILVLATLWQWRRVTRAERKRRKAQVEPELKPKRFQTWWVGLRRFAFATVALAFFVSLFAPSYDLGSAAHSERLQRLVSEGELSRPGLVFTPHDNFYLNQSAVPVALVAERVTFLSRLALPLTGKSAMGTIHEHRASKGPEELDKMRRAAAITSRTFEVIAPLIKEGVNEAEIERRILESYRDQGATGQAFKSIVGSGANATLPHYEKNNAVMTEGLVVIDIGCSVDGYASDMTRTFPVDGELSPLEAQLYEIVIAAGDASRDVLKAGATFKEVNEASKAVIEDAGFGPYYTHSVGHHVGLNVHDVWPRTFPAGAVFTIEPGIYIPAGAPVDEAYWNLGIRIEDTYIVTEEGWEEITSFPKRPDQPEPAGEPEPADEPEPPAE